MSTFMSISIVAGYVITALFVASAMSGFELEDGVTSANVFIGIMWPLSIVLLVLVLVIYGIYRLGYTFGEWLCDLTDRR